LIAGCPVRPDDGTGQAAPATGGGNRFGFAPGATIFSPGGAVRSGGIAGGINAPIGYGVGPLADPFGIQRGPSVGIFETDGAIFGGAFVDNPGADLFSGTGGVPGSSGDDPEDTGGVPGVDTDTP
jgi:hypothetical protein